MLGEISEVLFVIIALIGVGFLSYTYTSHPTINQPVETTQSLNTPSVNSGKSTTQNIVSTDTVNNIVPQTKFIPVPNEIVAPDPLNIIEKTNGIVSGDLSVEGVIKYTNNARYLNGKLFALVENNKLDRDAKIKLNDMFSKQYFEHVSPTGVGPSDLAKLVGYEYIVIGENLALGNFGNDAGLVDAWMNSPAHRANILNVRYHEIGVAVKKGMYQGNEVWIAVQSFGMPRSVCPTVDLVLQKQIDTNNVQIEKLKTDLDVKKTKLENTSLDDVNYNTYATDYNALVQPYNILIKKTQELINEYNTQTQAFNNCAKQR